MKPSNAASGAGGVPEFKEQTRSLKKPSLSQVNPNP